jgi:transposase
VSKAPFGHWQTSTLIQAIDQEGVRAALVVEGASNTQIFETFLEQILVPKLKPGDIVILDNLGSHKSVRAQELVAGAGAELRFLPPYSPDLNPIEKIFSKVKSILKKLEPRTRPKLWDAITHALQKITPEDCRNCFNACGYHTT